MTSRILLVALLASCSSETPPPEPTPEIASTLQGKREHGMLNCPSGVEGATTTVRRTTDGIDLAIKAPGIDAQRKISALAHAQARAGNPHGGLINDGSHGGTGTFGFCPIIHANTSVRVEELRDGVVIHVRPNDPAQLDALREATEKRVLALPSS